MKKIYLGVVTCMLIGANSLSAKPLSEAIENVDVTGSIAYRFNDYEGGTFQNSHQIYKVDLGLSSKVTDRIIVNTRLTTGDILLDYSGNADITNGIKSDTDFDITLTEVNFAYVGLENFVLTIGKQGVSTPWTVARDAIGNENFGTGAVASYNTGMVTILGGFYNQTNLGSSIIAEVNNSSSLTGIAKERADTIGASDLYVAGVIANFGSVNADVYYAKIENQFDTYTIGLNGAFDLGSIKLSSFARYTSLSPESGSAVSGILTNAVTNVNGDEDQSLWQVGLSANMGIFNAFAAYGESGKHGGLVYTDTASQTNMDYHWRITAAGQADTSYLYVHGNIDLTEKVNAGLYYSSADYKYGRDENEVYGQVLYKITSDFFTYVRFGQINVDNSDADGWIGRLHIQYSF